MRTLDFHGALLRRTHVILLLTVDIYIYISPLYLIIHTYIIIYVYMCIYHVWCLKDDIPIPIRRGRHLGFARSGGVETSHAGDGSSGDPTIVVRGHIEIVVAGVGLRSCAQCLVVRSKCQELRSPKKIQAILHIYTFLYNIWYARYNIYII
jgi:hypothetical protein